MRHALSACVFVSDIGVRERESVCVYVCMNRERENVCVAVSVSVCAV